MPQITTVRVVRKRSVQPEQFGNATAEVELTGNVLEGEDYKTVARQMLRDSRALVYENLGMKLPKSAVDNAEEVDTPNETATVETTTEETPKRGRGRPKGSTNKKNTTKAKDESNDIPGEEDDVPQIRSNPEDRKNPDDDDVPGDEPNEEPETENEEDDGLTAEDLHKFINDAIKAGKLTVMQAKQMQKEMKVARVRDLDTSDKVKKAHVMIESFIRANTAKT